MSLILETTGSRSEALARECADVVMQAGKLMSKPDRKLVEYKSFYLFGFLSMGLMLLLVLCIILFWNGNTIMYVLLGALLVTTALLILTFVNYRKIYKTILNMNEKVTQTFTSEGIEHNSDAGKCYKIGWSAIAFMRVLPHSLVFVPTERTGVAIFVERKHEDKVRVFLKEEKIPIKIVG
ncbi:MAG: hypothetical protein IK020_03880 [Clostridiales bacterium]|nr:hypothetical protein [Clostridiales bacterium]